MALMRKAQRKKAKLRLGLSGPAGGGKTMSALLMAYGITGDWEKICIICSENGSGELYVNYNQNGLEIGEYFIIPLTAPYTPDKYMNAIKECEANGIDCVIVDSLTHAWAGEGGLLDKKGQIEKQTGNGWTAWRDITPAHNRLVESILSSKCHIIATLRAKMDYVQEKNEQGKTVIKKVGMNPIQREGMEYEFTVFMDINQDHTASTTKDRTSLFDGKVWTPGIDTGRRLLEWLETGIDAPEPITEVTRQRIGAVAKKLNYLPQAMTDIIKRMFSVDRSDQLSEKQGIELAEYLETGLAAIEETATQEETA